MEKAVKIQIPEGYEIDREKSTFERIIFKPKQVTYRDVARSLFHKQSCYYISNTGRATENTYMILGQVCDANNCVTLQQADSLLALNQLWNVALYLNRGSSAKRNVYLYYNSDMRKFDTNKLQYSTPLPFAFASHEQAMEAVRILGEEEVKKAFGIFE